MAIAGLPQGGSVAIIGGGVAGAGLSAALVYGARARGRQVEVTVFEGAKRPHVGGAPALVTAECRSRLAALGCRIPAEWRTVELRGFEVISGGEREVLTAASGGLWVADAYGTAGHGRELIAQALGASAALQGVRFLPRTAECITSHGPPANRTSSHLGIGELVVRAGGMAERFHAVALAGGTASALLGDRFFPGYQGPPTVPAVAVRVRATTNVRSVAPIARLWLHPSSGVDGLYLIPCGDTLFAMGFGTGTDSASVCHALMMASRDGYLPDSLQILGLELLRLPCGAGSSVVHRSRLAVGTAAFGHPLQVGISETLASCTRAAAAILECTGNEQAMFDRYVRDGVLDLLEDSNAAARALPWLARCGPRAAGAVRSAARPRVIGAYSGGILGLPSPSPKALLTRCRWTGMRSALRGLFRHKAPVPAFEVSDRAEPGLVYVVDDEHAQRTALTELLAARGATVVGFADELALFAAIAKRPPAAVILDVVLTWVDGLRLCETLKQHPLTRNTRVIVVSGVDAPYVRARALAAGAEAFLPKPVNAATLWAFVGTDTALPRPLEDLPQSASV